MLEVCRSSIALFREEVWNRINIHGGLRWPLGTLFIQDAEGFGGTVKVVEFWCLMLCKSTRLSGTLSFRTSELPLDKGHANDDFNSHREARLSIDSEHNRNHAEVLQSVEYEQSPDCCAVEEERRQCSPPTAHQ